MTEVNDEATNALIASMLAEDNHYTEYDAYHMGPDSEDDDWGGSKKKPKKGMQATAKRIRSQPITLIMYASTVLRIQRRIQGLVVLAGAAGRKSKGTKAAAAPAAAVAEEEFKPDTSGTEEPKDAPHEHELSATGRRKRKDTGTNRTQSRGWSEEEERLFSEALELHGRDWKAAAAHVGTRDARAFTSHAQKFFIKLAIADKPVPAKVAETGQGYTLSGKPLDPTSAAARAYGLKPEILQSTLQSTVDAVSSVPHRPACCRS